MKKFLLIILLGIAIAGHSQLVPRVPYGIQNATTDFGFGVGVGSTIYDSTAKWSYFCIKAALATDDLTSAAIKFQAVPTYADTANNLRKYVFDAKGDLLTGTGNNTYKRLPIGGIGTFLRVRGDSAYWGSLSPADLDATPPLQIGGDYPTVEISTAGASNGYSLRYISGQWRAWPDSVGTPVDTSHLSDRIELLKSHTLYVGTGQTYSTIQAAINAASDGDMIKVNNGTYTEVVTISGKNNLSIEGEVKPRYSGSYSTGTILGGVILNGEIVINGGEGISIRNIGINITNTQPFGITIDGSLEDGDVKNIDISNVIVKGTLGGAEHGFHVTSLTHIPNNVIFQNCECYNTAFGYVVKAINVKFINCVAGKQSSFGFDAASDNYNGAADISWAKNIIFDNCISDSAGYYGFVVYTKDFHDTTAAINMAGYEAENIQFTSCSAMNSLFGAGIGVYYSGVWPKIGDGSHATQRVNKNVIINGLFTKKSSSFGLALFATDSIKLSGINYTGNSANYYSGSHATNVKYLENETSQWIVSGNNMYSNNSGNIGIGVTSPGSKLVLQNSLVNAAILSLLTFNDSTGAVSMEFRPSKASYHNAFIGVSAGRVNTTGESAVFVGYNSGYYNTTGVRNTFIGNSTGFTNVSGGYNTAIGFQALYSNTSHFNVATGTESLYYNSSGTGSVAVGYQAGYRATTGSYNNFIGYQAGKLLANGNNNSTPSNSIYIGYDTRANGAGEANQIVIGYGAIGLGANSIMLGNSSIATTALYGKLGIGDISPDSTIETSGGIHAGGGLKVDGKSAFLDDLKISSNHKIYIDGGTDDYIYQPTTNVIDFVTGGVQKMRVRAGTNSLQLGNDTSDNGSYPLSIINDLGSGIASVGVTAYAGTTGSTTFIQRTSGGTTVGSFGYNTADKALIGIQARVSSDAAWIVGAAANKGSFTLNCNGTHSATNYGTYWLWKVAALNSTAVAAEVMRMDGEGPKVTGSVKLVKVSATPTLASGETATYTKGNYYVIAYNDGGTMKYRYIDLTGTDATWTYSTTAP